LSSHFSILFSLSSHFIFLAYNCFSFFFVQY
jgi:hypothetical protein